MEIHKPVLPDEVLSLLSLEKTAASPPWFLDGTAGEGGHSQLVLDAFPKACLYLVDRDSEMLERAKARLPKNRTVVSARKNFSEISRVDLEELGIAGFSGILLDLGVSLYHFLHSGRGFSFKGEEPLDMRLEVGIGKETAAEFVNTRSVLVLKQVFQEFGEEKWALRIANSIVQERHRKRLQTNQDLSKLVERSIPRKFWPKETHPATRTFQALRIAVNGELEHAKKGIHQLPKLLLPGGTMAVISFHSLEDRIVKWGFREKKETGDFEILTKKPILPTEEEARMNKASRSAKLRGIQKSVDSRIENEKKFGRG